MVNNKGVGSENHSFLPSKIPYEFCQLLNNVAQYLKFVECEFGVHHYLETVDKYKKEGYKLIQVKDLHTINDDDKYLLIRHDVDLSLEAARILSIHEYINEIKSSYYILLYSPIYNALSPDSISTIKQIAKYNHEVGLHIDSRYEMNMRSVEDEMNVLSNISDTVVGSYVQHFINDTPPLKYPIGTDGLRDVIKAGFKYLSESSMNWREGCFCNHVNEYKRLTVAIHPEWHIFKGRRGDVIDTAMEVEVQRIEREVKIWKDTQVNYLKQFNKIGINA